MSTLLVCRAVSHPTGPRWNYRLSCAIALALSVSRPQSYKDCGSILESKVLAQFRAAKCPYLERSFFRDRPYTTIA
jgi:hypothetical protein